MEVLVTIYSNMHLYFIFTCLMTSPHPTCLCCAKSSIHHATSMHSVHVWGANCRSKNQKPVAASIMASKLGILVILVMGLQSVVCISTIAPTSSPSPLCPTEPRVICECKCNCDNDQVRLVQHLFTEIIMCVSALATCLDVSKRDDHKYIKL